MDNKILEDIEVYRERDKIFEHVLISLEKCLKNISLSTTQISLKIARIRFLIELEYAALKLQDIKCIDSDILYAYCCNISFVRWATIFFQHSQNIQIVDDSDFINGKYDYSVSKIDDRIVKGFFRRIEQYNEIEESDKGKMLSGTFLSSIESIANIEAEKIKSATAYLILLFSDYLNEIDKQVNSPSLVNYSLLYTSFVSITTDNDNDFAQFLEDNQDKPNFLSLLKERVSNFYDDEIKPICEKKEDWQKLFEWKPFCQPSYVKIGAFIWKNRCKKDKIEIAIKIVSLVNRWWRYNNIIEAVSIRNTITIQKEANNKIEETGNKVPFKESDLAFGKEIPSQNIKPSLINDSIIFNAKNSNSILKRNYNGKCIDMVALHKIIEDKFVINIKYGYEWFALWRILYDLDILIDNKFMPFERQMNIWYPEAKRLCVADSMGDYSSPYLGSTKFVNWDEDEFLKNRKSKQSVNGYRILYNDCNTLKDALEHIPCIQ